MLSNILCLIIYLICIKIIDILEIDSYINNEKVLTWICQFFKYFAIISAIIVILFGE